MSLTALAVRTNCFMIHTNSVYVFVCLCVALLLLLLVVCRKCCLFSSYSISYTCTIRRNVVNVFHVSIRSIEKSQRTRMNENEKKKKRSGKLLCNGIIHISNNARVLHRGFYVFNFNCTYIKSSSSSSSTLFLRIHFSLSLICILSHS